MTRRDRTPDKKSVVTVGGGTIQSVVYTAPDLAALIVAYFEPKGLCLDPCRGRGAFFDAMPEPRDWCEIQEGRDFFDYRGNVEWIITNPPWRGASYTRFAERCLAIATNVVFLVRLQGPHGSDRRARDVARHGHRLRETILIDWSDAGFTFQDGSAKAREGFPLAVYHWQRGWHGGERRSDWRHGKSEIAHRIVALRKLLRRCEDLLGRGVS